jgi:hypothetical protein
MQKSLTISRKNFGNEFLHGEKLEKFSFFSTGGFVVGGIYSPICRREIDGPVKNAKRYFKELRALWR